jgi:hypothetical protein
VDAETIAGSRAKVDRAEELLHGLAAECGAFLDEKPWPTWVEHSTEPGWHAIYVDVTAPVPPKFAVVVGELAHDLWSAVNHLAWREAVEFLGREPDDDEARRIAYPFTWSEDAFEGAEVRRYISKDASAIMQRNQPYACAQSEEAASLGVVHWYNRVDKHRSLQVTAASAPHGFSTEQLTVGVPEPASIVAVKPEVATGQRVEGKTKLVSIRIANGGSEPDVQVQGKLPLQPSFGKLPPKLRGADVLVSVQTVREVINDFANLIP